ncbi:MAG: hypothetical protein IJA16_02230, partial [Clostridia bacterium]|nr:hypothetical protein [Clostridia bacterium]
MSGYTDIMEGLAEFSELVAGLKSKQTPLGAVGVSDSVRAHLIFCVCEKLGCGGLIIAHNDASASEIYADLCCFAGSGRVMKFNASELMFYDAEARGRDVLKTRLAVLNRLMDEDNNVFVVTTPEALLSVTAPKDIWTASKISLSVGDEMELDELSKRLVMLGYKREEMVEGAGQFSIRGGIVDVFPYTCDNPVRIEFFDTEVDSIREFDAQSQRTIKMAEIFEATPAGEILMSDEDIEKLLKKLSSIEKKLDLSNERDARASAVIKRDAERIREKIYFPSMDKYIPYIYDKKPTILDYIKDDTVIFADEPIRISESVEVMLAVRAEQCLELYERGIMQEAKGEFSMSYGTAVKLIQKNRVVCMSGISRSFAEFKAEKTYSFSARSLGGFAGKPELMREAVEHYRTNNYKTIILAGTAERAKTLQRRLEEDSLPCSYQGSLEKLPLPGGVVVCGGSLTRGFEYPLIQTVVIGDREFFGGEKNKTRPLYRGKKGDKISDFTTLNPGDYVVHRNHGIGMYLGIEQLSVEGVRKDYLKISYKNSDALYVPTDQLDMV